MRKRRAPAGPPPRPPAQRDRRPPPRRTRQDDVRVAAAWVVERTLGSLSPVDTFLDPTLDRYDERDQGLLRALVMGTLRWLRRIDHVLEAASNRGFDRIEPALLAPLRVAAYQLLFLDRVPAHAAVNEAVEQARQLTHRGGASFVNAVLRRIARDPDPGSWPVRETDAARRLAVELSHPDFLVARWLERFGPVATRRLLAANNRPKPLQLLAFREAGGRELLAESLIDEGLEVEPSSLSVLGLTVRRGDPMETEAFSGGRFYVQDEAAQAAAWVPPPRPGESIFDAAAAPGGKSFALLAWEPGVRLTAGDVDPARLLRLRENLGRLGRAMPLVAADAGAPALAASFDRVVVDLPCTGTGTLRRHPELKWRISEEEVGRLSAQALRMLSGAASLVGPGGLLVAITCSLEREENEEVVAAFLERHPDFAPLVLEGVLPPPLDRWIRGTGFWRILTDGDHDGFSVHALERCRPEEVPQGGADSG